MEALLLRSPAPLAAKPSPLELTEVPTPVPGPGQIRVRVRACGVCHTDLHIVEGDITPPVLPVVVGHQVVGTVDAVTRGVERWRVGDRVGIAWLAGACGTCARCREGRENLCEQARFTGYDVPGGYAEAMVADARFAYPLPAAYDDLEAAPLLCAGIIGYRSLRLADVRGGERVGLFGFGASAHLAIQVARHWGCEVHVFTRSAAHRTLARALGAAWAGGLDEAAPAEVDRGVVFAPSGEVVVGALRHLRRGGTLAVNAIHLDRIPEFPYARLYWERTVRSVANATRADAEEFLAIAAELSLHVTVTRVAPQGANRALGALKRGELQGAAVLDFSGAPTDGSAGDPGPRR
ncbi:MAG TPA: zinc-dependent alcohol dehydrogenase family protein [bacterium]|nr:zinc-dependent alcohol dehydrogenase family protein [bacterium]